MAKDWKHLQRRFLIDNDKTGITAKDWCEQQGLNYQSARRYIKVRTAQKNSAQSAQKNTHNKTVRKGDKASQQANDKSINEKRDSENKNRHGRDRKGRFTEGNPGNTNIPTNAFEIGNQYSRKHGGYARRFDDCSLFDDAAEMSLQEELILCRARALSCIDTMKLIRTDIKNATSVEQRIELYNAIASTEQALDKNVIRIESITKTLSSIRIDDVNEHKIIADTSRIEAATNKLNLESDKLAKDGKGSITPISEMIYELQEMGSDGLMSDIDE
ncbi:TPA: hypothetical protein ACX6QL_002016 [Photobacterium damselae]